MSKAEEPEFIRDPQKAILVDTTFSTKNSISDYRRKFSGVIDLPDHPVHGRIFTRRETRPKKGFRGYGKMWVHFFLEDGESPKLFKSMAELESFFEFEFDPNQP